jgi:hypothetical protein
MTNKIKRNRLSGIFGIHGIFLTLSLMSTISVVVMAMVPYVSAVNDSKYSSSINFYGEKTDVHMGEDILAKLSIVNLVSNPKMHAQVIILPSSGMSVTSADFTKVSAVQFSADYDVDPGSSLPVVISLRANQVGEFSIKGRVVYYFGEDKGNTQDYVLDLPVSVRRPTVLTAVEDNNGQPKGLQGFGIVLLGVGLIAFILIFSVVLIFVLRR